MSQPSVNRTPPPGAVWALLLACFALSGASSLVLEVVWVRLLTQVFGSTNLAISTVLATFMGGLALGSWLGGRVVDSLRRDALWAYAACEAGVALSAFFIPLVAGFFPGVNAWLWGALGEMPLALALLRGVLCALLLLVPTTFMGATMPILSRAVIQSDADFGYLGGRVAILYAVNTAGALSGAFAAGFWLLPALGIRTLHDVAVATAFAVACLAGLLARWRNAPVLPADTDADSDADADAATDADAAAAADAGVDAGPGADAIPAASASAVIDGRLALLAFAVSGGVAMALQALFSRAFALILGSAIQSFTLVLVLFLAGLSLGAAIMGRYTSRSAHPLAWLGVGLTGAAAALLLVYSWLDGLPLFHHDLVRSSGVELDSPAGVAIRAVVAGAIAPVTFFLGA
ncbi:MAG: fused MFS/spermidine synthase, partial [Myxococcota bacterium]